MFELGIKCGFSFRGAQIGSALFTASVHVYTVIRFCFLKTDWEKLAAEGIQ